MKVFFANKKTSENTRKHIEKKDNKWIKPVLKGGLLLGLLATFSFGMLVLNQKMSVSYWDIEAKAPLNGQIERYFQQQKQLDFWHTRASDVQRALLLAIPDIKQVEVSRILPDGLQVIAVARQPLALWASKHGLAKAEQVMLVDAAAHPYRSLQVGEALDLPLLRLKQENLKQASEMLHFLEEAGMQRAKELSEVIVEEQRWRLNFSHGEQWLVQQENLEQDMGKIMRILDKPQWAGGLWRMDARIPQRWFMRPAKQGVI